MQMWLQLLQIQPLIDRCRVANDVQIALGIFNDTVAVLIFDVCIENITFFRYNPVEAPGS